MDESTPAMSRQSSNAGLRPLSASLPTRKELAHPQVPTDKKMQHSDAQRLQTPSMLSYEQRYTALVAALVVMRRIWNTALINERFPPGKIDETLHFWCRRLEPYGEKTIARATAAMDERPAEFPPNLTQFKALCRANIYRPEYDFDKTQGALKTLPAPGNGMASRDKVKSAIEQMRASLKGQV